MNVNEVAAYLCCSRDSVLNAINNGIALPKSCKNVKLECDWIDKQPEISDDQYNEFVNQFESEEPGRRPPAAVCRELRVEASFACAVCRREGPLQFHHLIEWSKLKHHDPNEMLSICGTCHDRCGNGEIDRKAQKMIKALVRKRSTYGPTPDESLSQARRTNDLLSLRELYSIFPRPIVELFLQQASNDRIRIYDALVVDGAIEFYYSTQFHISDAELRLKFEQFFMNWNEIFETSRQTHHDFGWSGVATLALDHKSSSAMWETHRDFGSAVNKTYVCLRELNSYLVENYPDLDLNESDKLSVAEWRRLEAEIEARFAVPTEERESPKDVELESLLTDDAGQD